MFAALAEIFSRWFHADLTRRPSADNPEGCHMASAHSLVELLDGVVMLYGLAAHKQLEKVKLVKNTL